MEMYYGVIRFYVRQAVPLAMQICIEFRAMAQIE
jgi:hypothetical protein